MYKLLQLWIYLNCMCDDVLQYKDLTSQLNLIHRKTSVVPELTNNTPNIIRLKEIMNLQRYIYSTAHRVGHWRKQMKT